VHQTTNASLAKVGHFCLQHSEVRTPQFDKTHRVLDSRQAAPKG
jgi:hypothetical protein